MILYIILYGMTIIFCILETNVQSIIVGVKKWKTADISLVVLSMYILLLGVLRGEELGVDSSNYKFNYWEVYKKLNFWEAIKHDSDWGYGILNWGVSRFASEFWIFRAVLFSVTFISIAVWIKKHSRNVSVSIFIYLSLGFLGFEFAILRQALAVSVFVWSYDFLTERKLTKFLAVILIAALCHKTALIMLIEYPLLTTNVKNGRKLVRYGYFMGATVVAIFGGGLIALFYPRNDYSQLPIAGGRKLLLYYIAIFIVLHFIMKRIGCVGKMASEYQLAISSLYFQIIATVVSVATRTLKYSTTYLFVLIPDIIDKADYKTKNAILFFIIILFSILYYKEFNSWETVPYAVWI